MGMMTGECSSSLAGLTADMWHDTGIHSVPDEVEVITWDRLSQAALDSPIYKSLHSLITSGAPEDKELWPEETKIYYQHRHALVPSRSPPHPRQPLTRGSESPPWGSLWG